MTKEVATLMSTDKLTQSFAIVTQELEKFDTISKSVMIQDDESLAIAENNIAQIKTLIDRTEAARESLGRPHYETKKMIDTYAKGIKDRLETFRQRIALPITNWRSLQEAARRAELEKQEEELRTVEQKKLEEAERLDRNTRIAYARLYGGVYRTNNGEKISDGCQSKEDCEALLVAIENGFPGPEQFTYLADQQQKVYTEIVKAVRVHAIDLIELSSTVKGKRSAAINRIAKNKEAVGLAVEKATESIQKKISSETRKIIKEGEKEVKEAAAGTRKFLKFRVINDEAVTREYLSVDESKIRAWMEGQNDKIKQMLKKGEQPLAGIEFYVETTYVSR